MLGQVALAKKCGQDQKKVWEEKGTTACAEILNLVDQALYKAEEQEAAECI